jgi:type IV secretory pathway component VirB8
MKSFGIEIDTNSDKWQKFAKMMRNANLSIPDYTKLKSTL